MGAGHQDRKPSSSSVAQKYNTTLICIMHTAALPCCFFFSVERLSSTPRVFLPCCAFSAVRNTFSFLLISFSALSSTFLLSRVIFRLCQTNSFLLCKVVSALRALFFSGGYFFLLWRVFFLLYRVVNYSTENTHFSAEKDKGSEENRSAGKKSARQRRNTTHQRRKMLSFL